MGFPNVPYESEVMSKARAFDEYGLTETRGALQEAKVSKAARLHDEAVAAAGGQEAYAVIQQAKREQEAREAKEKKAAADEKAALARLTFLASTSASLLPGSRSPPELPGELDKKPSASQSASAPPFNLKEKDMAALPSTKAGRELRFTLAAVLGAAARKAGGRAAFDAKRQSEADAEAAAERQAAETEFDTLALAWPALKDAALVAAAKSLAAEAGAAKRAATEASKSAARKRSAANDVAERVAKAGKTIA